MIRKHWAHTFTYFYLNQMKTFDWQQGKEEGWGFRSYHSNYTYTNLVRNFIFNEL